jgi:hypothetical protein
MYCGDVVSRQFFLRKVLQVSCDYRAGTGCDGSSNHMAIFQISQGERINQSFIASNQCMREFLIQNSSAFLRNSRVYFVLHSAAPSVVLIALLIALSIGAVLLFPSLLYLFKVFKGEGEHSTQGAPLE